MDAAAVAAGIARWIVPVLVGLTAAAVILVGVGWALRAARRSPRARAAAASARIEAGAALVRLDDAVGELDLEVGFSGALYGGGAPASLRRARMTAQHVRDEQFDEFRTISDDAALPPDELTRRAQRVTARATEALAVITHARGEHDRWIAQNSSAADQVAAARTHLDRLREQLGDPAALVRGLSDRFDAAEFADAAAAADAALADADEAGMLLDRAAAGAADPTRSALADLGLAERRIRAAETAGRRLEDVHRLVTGAADALPDEIAGARGAIRQALEARTHLEPDAAERLGAAIAQAQDALAGIEPDAARRPRHAIDGLVRLRSRLDLALGDARTAQQRLQGARSALPGAIAAAYDAVGRAEASVATAGADARVRLAAARDQLAAARDAADPVEALDAARRALRHAEDAQALADYDRLTR